MRGAIGRARSTAVRMRGRARLSAAAGGDAGRVSLQPATAQAVADTGWWQGFNDPVL